MSNRILLVEDDTTLSMIISETLQRDGFDVLTAGDGEEGLRKFTRYGVDLIIADVMMPRMDGFEMGRKIRQISQNVPLLFLTAKSEIDDIVEGFELGGNDYLKKPFKMLELIVRIKALLRRNVHDEDNRFEIGNYTLNLSTQMLSHPDKGKSLIVENTSSVLSHVSGLFSHSDHVACHCSERSISLLVIHILCAIIRKFRV